MRKERRDGERVEEVLYTAERASMGMGMGMGLALALGGSGSSFWRGRGGGSTRSCAGFDPASSTLVEVSPVDCWPPKSRLRLTGDRGTELGAAGTEGYWLGIGWVAPPQSTLSELHHGTGCMAHQTTTQTEQRHPRYGLQHPHDTQFTLAGERPVVLDGL